MKKEQKKALSVAVVAASAKKKAAKIIEALQVKKIGSNSQLEILSAKMKELKALKKEAEADYESIINPSKEAARKTKEAADAHFKPFFDLINNQEKEFKALVLKFDESQEDKSKQLDTTFKSGGMAPSTFLKKKESLEVASDSLTMRKTWKVTRVDKKKLPLEFLEPDMKAIAEACKAGKVPPGVKWEQVKGVAI